MIRRSGDQTLPHEVQGACGKVEFDSIGITFNPGGPVPVVVTEDLNFTIGDKQFVTVVGPSGCGKSTILNMLAGLLEPSQGRILIDGSEVADRKSHCAYMFQKDLLMPWRTILDNVALGVEVLGLKKREARERASDVLGQFGLGEFSGHYPSQLSGGMRQRAALARTLLCGRDLLLLDEPFAALDALTRSLMQEWLLNIWEEDQRTVVFITHDIEEAVFLSDRILLMSSRPGRIKAVIDVDIERPRQHQMITSPQFVEIKKIVLEHMYEEGRKAFGNGRD